MSSSPGTNVRGPKLPTNLGIGFGIGSIISNLSQSVGSWILVTGFWRDNGLWNDSAVWRD